MAFHRFDGTTNGDGAMTDRAERTVFVVQNFPPDKGGLASRMHDITQTLADEGHRVTVLAPPPSLPPEAFARSWDRARTERVDGVEVRRLWTWQPTKPDPQFHTRLAYYVGFALHALVWLLLNRRYYDTVVTTTPPISTGLAGATTVLTGANWVVDVRDLWIDASLSLGFIREGGVLERGSRRFQRMVLQRADAISVTTRRLGELLCAQYGGELDRKILHVPNGVNMESFRRERTPSTNPHRIVYTGNIGHAQGLDVCVEAMVHVEGDAVLWLVGGGDCIEELRKTVERRGIEDRVEFVGTLPRSEIPDILASATIGVAPLADHEELDYAVPTKVYEYMGCGLPVVAIGGDALRRFVRDSGGGVHVDHDPEALAETLDRLIEDEDRRREYGREGQEYVSRRYDRRAIARRFGDSLTELRARGAVSPRERVSVASADSNGRER